MTVTRHISLDEDYVEKIKPYVEKNNGNFGNALREIINNTGNLHRNSTAIDVTLLNWALLELDGRLIPDDVLNAAISPMLINSIGRLEDYLKKRFCELEWDIDIVIKSDRDSFPSDVLIEIRGSTQKIKFAASMVSQYLVNNSLEQAPLEIKTVSYLNECIKTELVKSNKKEAKKSLSTFFGAMDDVIETIKSRPDFWKTIISRHVLSNYDMVTIHRNYFEDMLANKIPLGEITIENLAKKPLQEIPLEEMLSLIKDVYETSRIADRVEIEKKTIALYHSFRSEETIEKLKKSLIGLLEANGHLYEAKSIANVIVLRQRPDAGIKMNEIMDNLRISHSPVDQELMLFTAFLSGMKNLEDIPLSMAILGRKFGASLMQEYESENNIKNWDLTAFQKVLEMIDSRLKRVSEWKLEKNNLLYTIKECYLAREGNTFDKHICQTARETIKGALIYAFGDRAELNINKLVTHGDNSCEVMIRIH
jgi:predicted hydrocarbon binding protein